MRPRSLVPFAVVSALACACTAIIGLPDLPAGPDGGAEGGGVDGQASDSPAHPGDGGGDVLGTEGGGGDATDAEAGSIADGHADASDADDAGDVTTTGGTVSVPLFNPTSQTADNDFPVMLSSDPGATICYTLDGTAPTCDAATGSCTGTSQTYNPAPQVAINGTVTNVSTGQVVVSAIACAAGKTTSASASQSYTLQVATPTMSNPAPGALLWPQTPYDPTISTATVDSAVPANAVVIWYTQGGQTPTCGTGTEDGNNAPVGNIPSVATTYRAIGCKTGYLPSSIAVLPYFYQMNPPALPPASTTLPISFTQASYDTKNQGANDWVCSTADGTTPHCGLPTSCQTGTLWPTTLTSAATVNAIACGNNATDSVIATVTY